MQGFKAFIIERREDDDLPQHIKGSARWNDLADTEGYQVFNVLEQQYQDIEYDDHTEQWYFIAQDSRTGRWVATQPVPSSFKLGRKGIPSTSKAIKVDDDSMTTQTQTTRVAAALDLAGLDSGRKGMVHNFFVKPSGPGGPPSGSGGPPGGSGGPPGGSGGPPGGGGPGGVLGQPGGGTGSGKLGGNPPVIFDGDRSKADEFMNDFNLYRMTNIDTDQMTNPMKRAALFLTYIKGPNVNDWVREKTMWAVQELQTGRPGEDEHYWTEIARDFQLMFQDAGRRERAQEKLRHLKYTTGDIDTLIARFSSLAKEAEFPLDAQNTLTMFAAKLPFRMMQHIYLNVKPVNFRGWIEAARNYQKDNTAVQNIASIGKEEGVTNKPSFGRNKTGFTPNQWAQILNVKKPTKDPNAMDTSADRARARKGFKARGTTTEETPSKPRREVKCFSCDKMGHIARNCPKKKSSGKQAEVEESSDEEEPTENKAESIIRLGRTMKEEDKIALLQLAINAEKNDEDQDF